MKPSRIKEWKEAQRICKLSDEEVRMAKELGFQPKSLLKNIPSRSQQWKLPVNEWVRERYENKIASRRRETVAWGPAPDPVIESRGPEYPWPDRPQISPIVLDYTSEVRDPSSPADIEDEDNRMCRHQCLSRWAAQTLAIAMSSFSDVQKVAAFGSVAQPLTRETPRHRSLAKSMPPILHECDDLDLAVWMTGLSQLTTLKGAMLDGLGVLGDTPYGFVSRHRVDIHLFDAASLEYRGRLCKFGHCPEPGKSECFVAGCGAQPYLQQLPIYHFNPAQFESEPKVILFDRDAKFLVHPPRIDVQPIVILNPPTEFPGISDDDVPF